MGGVGVPQNSILKGDPLSWAVNGDLGRLRVTCDKLRVRVTVAPCDPITEGPEFLGGTFSEWRPWARRGSNPGFRRKGWVEVGEGRCLLEHRRWDGISSETLIAEWSPFRAGPGGMSLVSATLDHLSPYWRASATLERCDAAFDWVGVRDGFRLRSKRRKVRPFPALNGAMETEDYGVGFKTGKSDAGILYDRSAAADARGYSIDDYNCRFEARRWYDDLRLGSLASVPFPAPDDVCVVRLNDPGGIGDVRYAAVALFLEREGSSAANRAARELLSERERRLVPVVCYEDQTHVFRRAYRLGWPKVAASVGGSLGVEVSHGYGSAADLGERTTAPTV